MTGTKLKVVAALLVVALVALAAQVASAKSGARPAAAKAAAAPAAAGADKVKIGFVVQLLDPYYTVIVKGAKAAAKANPSVEFLFGAGTSGADPATEIAKVQNMLAQGIKVLVVSPQGPGMIPVLNRAVSQGVKVIFIDTKLDGWNKQIAFIGTDNAAGSTALGKYLAKRLGNKGEVGIMPGLLGGCNTCVLRYKNFRSVLEKAGIKTYLASTADECTEDKAVPIVKNLLVSHPNTTALYSICGPSGIIITKVLADRPAGSKKILSVAWDVLTQEVKDIQAGKMDAAVAQFPVKLGKTAVAQAVLVSQGKAIPKTTDNGTAVVTKANAAQFLKPR